jgi:diguanylate cyclase (GGDEF)-like protein
MLIAVLPAMLVCGGLWAGFFFAMTRQGARAAGAAHTALASLEDAQRTLKHEAHYDVVTKMPNRSMFTHRMEDILGLPNARFAVLFLDLDRFKPINDTYGHDAGDFVLREVGHRLIAATTPSDLCARLGGDEFVVVTSTTDEANLHRLCRKLIQNISAEISYGEHKLKIGVSIGVTLSASGQKMEDVMRRADHALYEAKAEGRSRYRFFGDPRLPASIPA